MISKRKKKANKILDKILFQIKENKCAQTLSITN